MKQQGFTLIEVLVYLALFAVLFGGTLASVHVLISGSNKNQSVITLQQEGEFLMGKLNWALAGASSLTVNSATQITINKFDYGSNPVVFDLNSNKLRISQASGAFVNLNSDNANITNLTFTDIPALGAKPQGLKTLFTIQTLTSNGFSVSKVFETTKYLRK